MLLSAVSVLVVAQSSSEIPEGLMNNPVLCIKFIKDQGKYFNFIDVLFLYYGHQDISATHITILRVISLRTCIQL